MKATSDHARAILSSPPYDVVLDQKLTGGEGPQRFDVRILSRISVVEDAARGAGFSTRGDAGVEAGPDAAPEAGPEPDCEGNAMCWPWGFCDAGFCQAVDGGVD